MPQRKNNNNRRRKNKSRRSNATNLGTLTIVPLRYRALFPYAQGTSLTTATTAVPFYKTFNGTGVQFPYTTNDGGGHQPLGFDQMATLYTRYRTVATRYSVRFNNVSSEPISAAVIVKPYNVATVLWSTVMEKAGKKRVLLTQKGDMKSSQTISGYFKPEDILGVTTAKYNADDQYSAATSAIPAQTPFIQIYVSHHALTSVVTFVEVRLEYLVEFYEPVQLAGSVL